MSHNNNQTKGRLLKISILRYNPADPASVPHMQTFELEESASMTLFIALNELRDKQDPSLQFDFVCRAGICGSCAMMINGKPGWACRTLTRDLPTEFTLAPLPAFELIGDLSVNTGKWMRNMSERMETWVHLKEEEVDVRHKEEPMDPQLAEDIYLLDRCVECGCCIAGCGTHLCSSKLQHNHHLRLQYLRTDQLSDKQHPISNLVTVLVMVPTY